MFCVKTKIFYPVYRFLCDTSDINIYALYSFNMNTLYKNDVIQDPAVASQYPVKFLGVFGMIWISFLLLAMFTASKTFTLYGFVFVVGAICYPVTYIFSDIFTEVYGYRVSRRIVWTGFVAMLLVSAAAFLYTLVPPSASFEKFDPAFNLIFRTSPIVAFAFILGFFGGEFTNSFVLAKMKIHTKGRLASLRFIASTFLGQIVDNTIAFSIIFSFLGVYAKNEIPELILTSVIFCTAWEMLALPITYRAISLIKKIEGMDVYDHGTNFNPFTFRN